MSEITRRRCDHCTETVDNPYDTKGWIHIRGEITIVGSKSGSQSLKAGNYDFCQYLCFSDFVQSQLLGLP